MGQRALPLRSGHPPSLRDEPDATVHILVHAYDTWQMVTRTIPVFPLDLVLFPRQELALRVFEPRYKQLVDDCMVGDGLFGVCLAGDGMVAGWEAPVRVGTITKIIQCQDAELDGMQLQLQTMGRSRFAIIDLIPPSVAMPSDYNPTTLEGHQRFQDLYEKAGPGKMYIRAKVEVMPELDQGIPASGWIHLVKLWKEKTRRQAHPKMVDAQQLDDILRRYYLVTDTPTPDYVYSLAALGAASPADLQPILEADTISELIERVQTLMEAD